MPQFRTIKDASNGIVFNIARIPEKPKTKAKHTIASNLMSLWIGKEIPEEKKDIIREWHRKNPEIPFTLWYHSDYAENIPQWEATAKKHNFSLCDLKTLEKSMDPDDVALARYYIAGPHANYAAASDIYRLAAMRYMLTLVKQIVEENKEVMGMHEVGFIYRDMDVRCGDKQLPASLDGIFLFNHFNLNSDETIKLIYTDAKQPIKGRIGNDIFAVGAEGLHLLINLQEHIGKFSYEALEQGHHYLGVSKEERVWAYISQTVELTGPVAWKKVVGEVGILKRSPVPPDLETNLQKLTNPDVRRAELRLAPNEYCENQLMEGWYFKPFTYFKTAKSDGSWLEKSEDGKDFYLKYKKYENQKELLKDLNIRINFELKVLPKEKVFIDTYLEDVIEHYPNLFVYEEDVERFINNLYKGLTKDLKKDDPKDDLKRKKLADNQKQNRNKFKNIKPKKPEVPHTAEPAINEFGSVKNSTFIKQEQITSDQPVKQIASDQSVKINSTEKTTHKTPNESIKTKNNTSNESILAFTEKVPFSALMELGLFTLSKLGMCRMANKLGDVAYKSNYLSNLHERELRKQSAQLFFQQEGSSLEEALLGFFDNTYKRANDPEQIRMENFIIDFANGEFSDKVFELFTNAMKYQNGPQRGKEMLKVMKAYEEENVPNEPYSFYPNQ